MYDFRISMIIGALSGAFLALPAGGGEPEFSQVVVFGDSTVEAGNLHIATNGAITAPPYFAGRFCDGPVWVDVLAQEIGLDIPLPSLLGGLNYAWGGAESGGGISFNGTPNVGLQIEWYLADHGPLSGDELIVVAVGANDLLWDPPNAPRQVARNIAEQIEHLALAGGRTFFVPTIALYADSPLLGGPGKAEWFDSLAKNVNKFVDQELADLQSRVEMTIIRPDLADWIDQILLNPISYGLINTTDSACPGCGLGLPAPDAPDTLVPNPQEYLWWDLAHWSRAVHGLIGAAAADLVQ